MTNLNKIGYKAWPQRLAPLLVVVMVSVIGAYLLSVSHAATTATFVSNGAYIYPKTSNTANLSLIPSASGVTPSTPSVEPDPTYLQACVANPDSATCYQDFLKAVNHARTILDPGIKPITINIPQLMSLPTDKQLFVLVNAERVDRGLQPIVADTIQLDGWALTGAQNRTDPHQQSSTLAGGANVRLTEGNWGSGNDDNPLVDDYYWMYADGAPSNKACSTPGDTDCWGHRDHIIESRFASVSGCNPYMGGAYAATSSLASPRSFAEVFVEACGAAPTDQIYTWQQALSSGIYTPPVAPPPCQGSTLYVNQRLSPGQCLISAGGQYELNFSPDTGTGSYLQIINAVTKQQLWTTHCGPGFLAMQSDGNLVQFIQLNSLFACWSTGTSKLGGTQVIMQDDGTLVMKTASGAVVWTNKAGIVIDPPSTLNANEKLYLGEQLFSAGNKFRLVLQTDGNLVIRNNVTTQVTWATGTNNKNTADLAMQPDGNLVLYDNWGRVLWTTNTRLLGGTHITMQDDGNLVMFNAAGTAVWSIATGVIPPPPPPPSPVLSYGQTLKVNQYLLSPSGTYQLILQPDGNLVEYNSAHQAVWQANTFGQPSAYLTIASSGDLGLIGTSGQLIWHAGTFALSGTKLVLQDDGNLVEKTSSSTPVWSIHSGFVGSSVLASNQALFGGQYLISSSRGEYRLVMQRDGNLVDYDGNGNAVWSTGTQGSGNNNYVVMQPDGNFIMYTGVGQVVWYTNTVGMGGSYINLQVNGNVVMFQPSGYAVWSWQTGRTPPPPAILYAGQNLSVNHALRSPSGAFQLILQPDGNLVEYNSAHQAVWQANTFGQPSAYLTVASNGDLRLIGTSGQLLWHIGTFSLCANQLVLQDDGNFVMKNGSGTPVWSLYTGFVGSSTLGTNQTLGACQFLVSSFRGEYRLVMQPDGNLVDYDGNGTPVWYTNTQGTGANHAVMQQDGNFVLYNAANQPIWYTNTIGMGGTYLVLQVNANLVMFQPGGWAVWSWQTGRTPAPPPPPPGSLLVNQNLYPNQSLIYPGSVYQLILQPDGNLVIYNNSGGGHRAIWQAPGAYGKPPGRLIVQPDGNLVLYSVYNYPIWYVGLGSGSNNYLTMQPDGNLVYYNSLHQAIWWSGTYGF